jgi:hypothetical protein
MKDTDCLEDRDIDGRMILNIVLGKWVMKMSNGLKLRTLQSGSVNAAWSYIKAQEISWPSDCHRRSRSIGLVSESI